MLFCQFVCVHALGSEFGNSGLVSVPSARHLNDGELAATIASNPVVNIFNITYQATPWFETTFRYSVFNPYGRDKSGDLNRDRSYEAKFLLRQESDLWPQVSVGIRDVLGTGVWSGEYLVASKLIGKLDLTLGMGWGRLADADTIKNPLRLLSSAFETRPIGAVGGEFGGEVRGKSFFRGPVGLFGGLHYNFAQNFALILERNSDSFLREQSLGSLKSSSALGIALAWSPTPFLTTSVNFQQGDYLGLTLRTVGDFKDNARRKFARVESSADREANPSVDGVNEFAAFWYENLLADADSTGLRLHQANFAPGSRQVGLKVENMRYEQAGDAIHQALVLSELHLPSDYDEVRIYFTEKGFPASTVIYQKKTPENSFTVSNFENNQNTSERVRIVSPGKVIRPSHTTDFQRPRLWLGADLGLRVQVMDPDAPLKRQLYLKGTANLEISDHLSLWSSYSLDIDNNFDNRRTSDSLLPRVRSEINRYLTEGENGVDSIYLEYKNALSPSLFIRSYAGVLEEMFGGLGGELLWNPFAKRWALGANLNWVKKRDYEKDLGFQDYSVLTGHVSGYYASPWYNLDFALHLGSYLAKDVGYTFEARRTFDNGFAIGAFFSRTNVSAVEFGEGSFDKGLYLKIPFNLFTPFNTRSNYRTVIRSVERDGGRRLEGFTGELWWERRSVRFDALQRQRDRMVP